MERRRPPEKEKPGLPPLSSKVRKVSQASGKGDALPKGIVPHREEKFNGEDGASFLYLYSNNSPEQPAKAVSNHNDAQSASSCPSEEAVENLANLLSPYHRRAAYALHSNVNSLIATAGLDRLGFLTLTYPDNCTDYKQAGSRFNSFSHNFLLDHPHYGHWLCVKERQKRGAWHYHLLIDTGEDIRTGINWDELERRCYQSASPFLRERWKELRENLPKYGFGRSELLPIKGTGEAMSRYVGKYVSKNIGARPEEDKGVRLCSYSKGWPRSNPHFQWHTPNSQEWRAKVKAFAEHTGCASMDDLRMMFGSKWAFHYAGIIIGTDWQTREQKAQEAMTC